MNGTDTDLIRATNTLMTVVGLNEQPFETLEEIVANASSLSVAVFEAIFDTRLVDVDRSPNTTEDYAYNAQLVVDSLKGILQGNVDINISGDALAAGDVNAISFIVALMQDIAEVIKRNEEMAYLETNETHERGEVDLSASSAPRTPTKKVIDASLGSNDADDADSIDQSADGSDLQKDITGEGNAEKGRAEPITPPPPRYTTTAVQTEELELTGRRSQEETLSNASIVVDLPPSLTGGAKRVLTKSPDSSHKPPIAKKTTLTKATPMPKQSPKLQASYTSVSPRLKKMKSAEEPSTGSQGIREETLKARSLDTRSIATSFSASAASAYRESRRGGALGQANSVAEELRAIDERRAIAAQTMTMRRQRAVFSRLQQRNEEELRQIQSMTMTAIRSREAEYRVAEAKALKAATARARAAKHERKTLAIRTRRTLEDMSRHTLALRIARSSRQAAASSTLLKALAGQARLAAAEQIKIAAEERAKDILDAQARVAWLNHTARLMNEVVLEETARQVTQRQAAAKSQKEALLRAMREMKADEAALLQMMRDEQTHAEEVFLAQHVEPMEILGSGPRGGSRGGLLGVPDSELLVQTRLQDFLDTDEDISRVMAVPRVQNALKREGETRREKIRSALDTIHRAALDTGQVLAESDALEMQAMEQAHATLAEIKGLSGTHGRSKVSFIDESNTTNFLSAV